MTLEPLLEKRLSLRGTGGEDIGCIICFSDMKIGDEVARLSCDDSHMFHEKCLKNWFTQCAFVRTEASCPICRGKIE